MGVDTETVSDFRQVHVVGGLLAGFASKSAPSPSGLTAILIAARQEVAHVLGLDAAITYARLLDDGDYWSSTLTSLIHGIYGGAAGLLIQRGCLELLGCYGKDKARTLAEIRPATVIDGAISLTSAFLAVQCIDSRERLRRNR